MENNEMMAMANARDIEKLPYDTLKALFPSVRYMVQGEKWYRKFIGHRTNETTGKEETYAAGEWRADLNGKSFDNPTMATMWAQMNYSKGHYKVYAFVPELHKVSNQIVNEQGLRAHNRKEYATSFVAELVGKAVALSEKIAN